MNFTIIIRYKQLIMITQILLGEGVTEDSGRNRLKS